MNASSIAAWSTRGIAFSALIAYVCHAFFNFDLSDDQQTAISAICGFILIVAYPAYEAAHAKGVAQKQELAHDNIKLASAVGQPPLPLATQTIKDAKQ